MKTFLLATFGILLCSSVHAQTLYSNSSTGNVSIGTTSPIAGLDVQNAITSASGVAYGGRYQQTLTASANNDALTALYINPTFTNGSYTGVANNGLIIASGVAGIGTTSPIAGLDVQNTITSASGAAYGGRYQQTLTASANNDELTALYINPTFTNGSYTGVGNNGLVVASGYVGIGTTAPAAPLHVSEAIAGGGGPTIEIDRTSSTYQGFLVFKSGSTREGAIGMTAGTTATLQFNTGPSTAAMTLTGGDVGIGTASPGTALDVYGAGGWTSGLRLEYSGASGNGYNFVAATDGNMYIAYGSASAPSAKLALLSGGNFGIGTTTPSQTLDVNGKVHVGTFAASTTTTVCQNAGVLSSCTSALRFKDNVQPSSIGLSEVLKMKPVTYDIKDHKDNWEKHDFGFIAEDMKDINPLFVTYDDKGEINGVRYMQLTAVNVKATQQLYALIEKQHAVLAEQQKEIDELKHAISRLTHQAP